METQEVSLPVLDSEEIRVLGVLIEKSRVTPEYYPMTINSIVVACNQKTSRKPVVNYNEQTVILILDRLKSKRLVSTATGGTSRVTKYKHNLALLFTLPFDELAVICLLLLRGPQTPGELNTNSGRLYEFDNLEEVQNVLDKLSSGNLPFVKQLPRQPGQKEARFMHLLGRSEDLLNEYSEDNLTQSATSTNNDLEERLGKVEKELSELKEAFEKLMKELM